MSTLHATASSGHISTTISDNSGNDLLEKLADEPSTATSESFPPDGGRIAWLTLAGAWMVQFCTFGYLNAFGVYQDFYTREFLSHETPSSISWIGSLQLFLMYAPAVVVGRAFDAGYFRHVQLAGSLLHVFSIFMLSLTTPERYYQVLLAQGVGVGLGAGMLFLPSLSVVSHHFRRRRALATGIAVSGASCGGVLFPIMLNQLFANPKMGFANGVRASGALVAVLLTAANAIMRTRSPSKRHGFLPVSHWKHAKRILVDHAYTTSVVGAFCTNLGLFVPFFYLQLFAADHGVNATITTYILAILNAGSTLGRVLPVALANRLGVYNMLLFSILMSAVLIFALFGATSVGSVITVAVLFGFSSGAYVSLVPPLLGMLCTNHSELGLRMGLAFSVVGVSMLIGTPIFGVLLNTDTSGVVLVWWKALVFAGVRHTLASVRYPTADVRRLYSPLVVPRNPLALGRFGHLPLLPAGMHCGRGPVYGHLPSPVHAARPTVEFER
ncbi:MFS general substrate transporter [Dichomitus squalens]|uniref:MFS general substrate transporter n=1 Tax=Dichomitus squalens TaxID=114155 RepID=A0A4Q9M741_9APHY|nr:MFS general substrate transporter [Dichomitus squalens]